ncbi:Macrophage asialoglycoprotein-binding protein 1 [Myotis brandtii]|uniref:Macrophage asialoglycoprotein-binding protein 1 n=1 Tax=Myotis brandtii TaxID=109478 RepID=S7Q3F0_MYOBR|nr:PREDICTED: C-type lectin domain family 10 member A [Myotis brandtii]EPQ15442.1 Macrophage asialoglycoprotein-binding protein 1 [Myotis brandtii]
MSMKHEDLQSLESEKKSQGSRNGLPPPPAFLQHLCSGPWPLLLSLGLILLLMIGICVIGSKNANMRRDLETLRATFSNFTSNTMAEVQALHSQGGSLQTTITSLKAVVENQEQELQAARSLNDTVFSLESKLEKEQQEFKADYSEMLLQVQQLVNDLNSLHCQMAALKSNGEWCVGQRLAQGWANFLTRVPQWVLKLDRRPAAEKHCQLKNAHLVVLSSWNEQKFLEQHMYRMDIWIGLTEQHDPWTWVNGIFYNTSFQNWSPTQPDNWYYHGQEYCAHFGTDDLWKNYLCMIPFHWICETELNRSSS